ncbi:hypothetical protein F5148DRAFT_11435 [Russula earlei]|uniref:Uncharacterized protein n=1 Tax=Russula earlei TaxID=71964 RepID=A0ACC0UPJ2_9AGAM|nr:hypothetical protein F5148DRAFT_11435 [Russula earlei]
MNFPMFRHIVEWPIFRNIAEFDIITGVLPINEWSKSSKASFGSFDRMVCESTEMMWGQSPSHFLSYKVSHSTGMSTPTLVCKQWRALATDILYEDIRIGGGMSALHAAFSDTEQPEQPIADGGAAPPSSRHHVRRATLPYEHTATPTRHAPPALALLAPLPHLEVLVRPPTRYHDYGCHGCHAPHHHHDTTTTPRFEFPTGMPALPALRRLEWAFDPTGAATRAGGINALDDVLRAATAEPLEPLWEAFGGQVRMLEMDLATAGGVPMVDVGRIARACPALEVTPLGLCTVPVYVRVYGTRTRPVR